jgi:hypothetical protein
MGSGGVWGKALVGEGMGCSQQWECKLVLLRKKEWFLGDLPA